MTTRNLGQPWIERFLVKVENCDLDESDRKCSICKEPFFGILPDGDPEPEVEDRFQQELSHFKLYEVEDEDDYNENAVASGQDQEVPVRLSCGHIFGKFCITHWLNLDHTCPMCRSTAQAHASARIGAFGSWRRDQPDVRQLVSPWRYERADMLQRISDYYIQNSTYLSITNGRTSEFIRNPTYSSITIRRASEFIQRETNADEVPSLLIRGICHMMADDSMVLINGHLEQYVEGWAAHPEIRRFSISRHPSDAEIAHMIGVMRRELRECTEEIDRLG